MRSKRTGNEPARGPRLVVAMTESSLHKQGALAADDRLIEVKVGQIRKWSIVGSQQELPQPYAKIDIRKMRGVSGCGYSARRLFFLTNHMPIANLEHLWHVTSQGRQLRMVFSAPKLITVWWGDDALDAAELAGFAERLMAQRDRALAALSPESRQLATDYLALLQRSGLLAFVLADRDAGGRPGDSALPITKVGRWLRAAMLGQRELRDQLAKTLDRPSPALGRRRSRRARDRERASCAGVLRTSPARRRDRMAGRTNLPGAGRACGPSMNGRLRQ